MYLLPFCDDILIADEHNIASAIDLYYVHSDSISLLSARSSGLVNPQSADYWHDPSYDLRHSTANVDIELSAAIIVD